MTVENRVWFEVEKIDEKTFVISEYHHWEKTHCYLLIGEEKALLIDSGLGVGDMGAEVRKLTDKPVIVVATHVHWDHMGGHRHFSEFYVHQEELDWVSGNFPLPLQVVRKSVFEADWLPDEFNADQYEIFSGTPARLLEDNDTIDLGDRLIRVLHTPGHSPGHLCFFEEKRGYLFTGDLIYKGTLMAFYPSTDPVAYFESVKKVAKLSIEKIFPGHFELDIPDGFLQRVVTAFEEIEKDGLLQQGSGVFSYDGFQVHL